MAMANGHTRRCRRDVEGFAGDARLQRRRFHRLEALTEQALHLGFEHIGPLAHHGALIAGELAHRPEHTRQTAFFAQQADPQLFEGIGISSSGNLCRSLGFQGLQLVGELLK